MKKPVDSKPVYPQKFEVRYAAIAIGIIILCTGLLGWVILQKSQARVRQKNLSNTTVPLTITTKRNIASLPTIDHNRNQNQNWQFSFTVPASAQK